MALINDAISSLLGTKDTWNWFDKIRPASFRGVPFGVLSVEGVFGRRQAVHEYPYRNTAWVEDLGRGTRKMTIRGFIVHNSLAYNAPDVITQRNSLIAACEMEGAGTLIHPTLGELTVSIPDGGLRVLESVDSGRSFEFMLTVIESGLKVFALTGSTQASSTVQENGFRAGLIAATRFVATVKGEIRSVTQTIKTLHNTAVFWGNMVKGAVNEVTNLSNVLKSTFGSSRYGRYSKGDVGGNVSGATGVVGRTADTGDYTSLVNQKMAMAVTGRADLIRLTEEFEGVSSVEEFPVGARNIINEILAFDGSVEEKIRMLELLATYQNSTFYATDAENAAAQSASILLSVLSATAMAIASAGYEPSSYNDAISMLNRVCDTLDTALLMAADAGDDEDYLNLLETRKSLVAAYEQKGTKLSSLTQVSLPSSLPALTLANRLYQDSSRGDELVQTVSPRHPAFMPARFKALRK